MGTFQGRLAFALYSAYSAYTIHSYLLSRIYSAANFAVSNADLSTRNKLVNHRSWNYIYTPLFIVEPGLPLFRTCSPVSNSPSTTVLQLSSLTAGERLCKLGYARNLGCCQKYVRSVWTKMQTTFRTKAARVYTNCDLPSFSVLRKETIEKNRHFFQNKIIFFVRKFCLHPWKNVSIVDLMPLSYEAENHYLLCQYTFVVKLYPENYVKPKNYFSFVQN